jgi:hypothetical protein
VFSQSARNQRNVSRGLGRQSCSDCSGFAEAAREHLFQAIDLGCLIDLNVIRELEYDFVLRRTGVLNSESTIVIAPRWCWIMYVMNSRSNSTPRDESSCAI